MRKLAFGLILCLLLSCGGSPAEEPAEAQGPPVQVIGPEEDWREVYVKFLEDLCEEERAVLNVDRPDYDPNLYPAQVGSLSQEYFLYDLDWDGVPELVLRFGWDSWDTRFYTVRDGEVTEVGREENRYISFFTSPDRPGIIVRDTPKGPVFVYRLTLEDGELRQGEYLYETDMETMVGRKRRWRRTRSGTARPGRLFWRRWRVGRRSAPSPGTAGAVTRGGPLWRSIHSRAGSRNMRKNPLFPGGGPGWI